MALKVSDILIDFTESPPIIYHKLQQALKDPENSFGDFASIIETDPNLTARILKLVNSVFYGLSTKVETVAHAISLVGLNQLIELALSTEIVSKFKGIPNKLLDIDAFWVHCLACGLAGRAIAANKGKSNPESFYLAGLLHDIGRLVILKKLPKESREVLSTSCSSGKELSLAEKDIIGFNHDEVGKVLLEEWNLSERLVEAVQFHHSPLKAPKYRIEALIIHVADIVAYDMKLGNSGEGYIPKINPKILNLLKLSEDFMKSLQEDVQLQVNQTAEILLS